MVWNVAVGLLIRHSSGGKQRCHSTLGQPWLGHEDGPGATRGPDSAMQEAGKGHVKNAPAHIAAEERLGGSSGEFRLKHCRES